MRADPPTWPLLPARLAPDSDGLNTPRITHDKTLRSDSNRRAEFVQWNPDNTGCPIHRPARNTRDCSVIYGRKGNTVRSSARLPPFSEGVGISNAPLVAWTGIFRDFSGGTRWKYYWIKRVVVSDWIRGCCEWSSLRSSWCTVDSVFFG